MKTATLKTRNGSRDTATREITIDVLRPDDLDEAIEMYGGAIVFDMMVDQLDVRHQSFVRSQLNKVDDKHMIDDAIATAAIDWKPTTGRTRRDPVQKLAQMATKMTPTQRAALIAELERDANGV